MRVLDRALRLTFVLALALGALVVTAAPVAADEPPAPQTELQQIVDIAKAQLGAKWVFAATGPDQFDCSGFVTYVYRQAGLIDRIGGKRRTVSGYLDWFRAHDKADHMNPQPGDLIVWGRNQHIGIYLGDGMAISALINPYGVKVHPVLGYIGMKVKAYLHVDLEREAPTPQ